MKLSKMIHYIAKKIKCKISPEKYYRSIGVKLGKNTRIYSKETDIFSSEPWLVSLGDNCHITGGVKFITHDNGTLILPRDEGGDFVLVGDIKAGNNVIFGYRSIILPGVTIGNNVIIGAGSIVTKDIPDNSVVAGVPAKVISDIASYKEKVAQVKSGNNPKFYSNLDDVHSQNPRNKLNKRK